MIIIACNHTVHDISWTSCAKRMRDTAVEYATQYDFLSSWNAPPVSLSSSRIHSHLRWLCRLSSKSQL